MMLTPLRALKKMVEALSREQCRYCLIGGHAASLYRAQERFTKDVDFALVATANSDSHSVAKRAIKAVGLDPVAGFIPAGAEEAPRKSICMITSRPTGSSLTGIVDILLPEIPWVPEAVERAQANLIDLGFAMVPVITPEDLIVAKCFAFRSCADRFQDLDDLKQLFISVQDLDLDYLSRKLAEYSLTLPEQIRKFAPKLLRARAP